MQEIVKLTNHYTDTQILIERYCKYKGITPYYYGFSYTKDLEFDKIVKVDKIDDDDYEFYLPVTKNFGEVVNPNEYEKIGLFEHSLVIIENYAALIKNPVDRTDPDLIKAVRELNNELSEEEFPVTVIEIPDAVNWYIQGSDFGWETIQECHRSW